MSGCTQGMYLRRSCAHLPEEVPLVSPINLTNFSSYGKFSEELLSILAQDDDRLAVIDAAGNVAEPEDMLQLLQMSADIRAKVNEIQLLVITATMDQQMLLGEIAKETCPAIEAINYTCPEVICKGNHYVVSVEWDYFPSQIACALLFVLALVWRKRK